MTKSLAPLSLTPSVAASSAPTANRTTMGQVTLVGAGPGDPDLLTLKAVKAIAAATVLLVDDLVNEAVLAHASPSARVIHVGKRGGCQSTPQAFIEKRMIAEALQGERVVRLKGGDPLIFGRAGEELEALRAAGVTHEVVNGITSGLAAATALHMPLTHRAHAHGVLFVTGHAQSSGKPTDWNALGEMALQHQLTLVIYMGVSQAAQIQTGLLAHLPARTPVAFVKNASCTNEATALTTLDQLMPCLEESRLGSPLIMVIGEVAKLAQINATEACPPLSPLVSLQKGSYNARLVA